MTYAYTRGWNMCRYCILSTFRKRYAVQDNFVLIMNGYVAVEHDLHGKEHIFWALHRPSELEKYKTLPILPTTCSVLVSKKKSVSKLFTVHCSTEFLIVSCTVPPTSTFTSSMTTKKSATSHKTWFHHFFLHLLYTEILFQCTAYCALRKTETLLRHVPISTTLTYHIWIPTKVHRVSSKTQEDPNHPVQSTAICVISRMWKSQNRLGTTSGLLTPILRAGTLWIYLGVASPLPSKRF